MKDAQTDPAAADAASRGRASDTGNWGLPAGPRYCYGVAYQLLREVGSSTQRREHASPLAAAEQDTHNRVEKGGDKPGSLTTVVSSDESLHNCDREACVCVGNACQPEARQRQ